MPYRKKTRFFFTLLLLGCSVLSAAQEMVTRRYTNREGLPVDDVYCAAQDDDGFMWFGTAFGIAQFDGRKFVKHYYRNEGMARKAVPDIKNAGGDSLIFISYPSALQSIHRENGQIVTLAKNFEPLFRPNRIEAVGKLFFIYQAGSATDKFGIWTPDKKLLLVDADSIVQRTGIILNMVVSVNGNGYLMCTNQGAFLVSNGTVETLTGNENISCALYTRDKKLVLSGDRNIYIREGTIPVRLLLKLPPGFRVNNMEEDADGKILLGGSDKGVRLLDGNTSTDISSKLSLESGTLRRFFRDSDDNMWFCTNAGILLKKRTAFNNIPASALLSNNSIEQLFTVKSGMLVGTANGLFFMRSDDVAEPVFLPPVPGKTQFVHSIFDMGNGITGVAVTGIETKKAPWIYIHSPAGKMMLLNCEFAASAGNGSFWMFNERKLLQRYVHGNAQPVETINTQFSGCQKIFTQIVYNGQQWFGTDKGIIHIDQNDTTHIDAISNVLLEQVFKFVVDRDMLWIATDNGLFYYRNQAFHRFSQRNGYNENYCEDFVLDDQKVKWTATWDGIVQNHEMAERKFSIRDGLVSRIVNCIAFDESGKKLYAGTNSGLSVLKLNDTLARFSKRAFITCFRRDLLQQRIKERDILEPGKYSLTFNISIPEYGFPEEINIDYRMDDGEWQPLKDFTVSIDDIRYGEHHFYVRPHMTEKYAVSPVTEFVFTIKQPYYKAWWFIALMIILAQGIIILLFSYINKRNRRKALRKHQQLLELATLRQKAFTTLINPHFIFNALNSIQHYINRQDRQAANRYLSDFASLIRRNFDAAQQAFIPLDQELENIRLYLQLEKMRFPGKFEYDLFVAGDVDEEDQFIPSMILQPFLENAILHGVSQRPEAGLLKISIERKDGAVSVTITDNGIGMEKSRAVQSGSRHKSRGMQLIREKLSVLSRFGNKAITLDVTEAFPGSEYPGVQIKIIIPDSIYNNFPGEAAVYW